MGYFVTNGKGAPKTNENSMSKATTTKTIEINSEESNTISESENDILKAELKEKYDITEPESFVRGDATGKWRYVLIYNKNTVNKFAVDYAKAYMQSGDIHYIINFYLKTTSMLQLNNDILIVRTTEYVDKEELNASVIGGGLLLSDESYDMTNGQLFSVKSDESAGTVSAEDLISNIKKVIDGGVGKDEKIIDVIFNGSELQIIVDFSKADTSILTARDIALSRISSITDPILDLDDSYTNTWDTIVIDFGDVGKAVLNKKMIHNNGFGKYFEYSDDILK